MDWIKARVEWTPDKALAALKQRLKDDIEAWRGHVSEHESSLIRVGDPYSQLAYSQLIVERMSNFGRADRWVSVSIEPNEGVKYRFSPDGESITLHALLNERGEPRLRLGDRAATEDGRREQDLELWQASRKILETLLF